MPDLSLDNDDDLIAPAAAARTPPPKDPATGQFISPSKSPAAAEPAPPAQPQHSSYMLAKARQYGVTDAAAMSAAELDRLLTVLERTRQPEPTKPQEPAEEPFDWGTDEHGKPLTEATAKEYYQPAIYRAMLAGRSADRLEKRVAAFEERERKREQEAADRQVTRQLNKILAARPDLFGDKPGEAEPGSVQAERYDVVVDRLRRLVQQQKHTTLKADAEAAMALFGPAPDQPQTPTKQTPQTRSPSLADYRGGELATPTGRRGTEPALSRREQRIAQLEAERRENGTYVHATPDDDSDLIQN